MHGMEGRRRCVITCVLRPGVCGDRRTPFDLLSLLAAYFLLFGTPPWYAACRRKRALPNEPITCELRPLSRSWSSSNNRQSSSSSIRSSRRRRESGRMQGRLDAWTGERGAAHKVEKRVVGSG